MSQPQHTPGSCGCYISPPREDIGQALSYCPIHAAAPEMLASLRMLLSSHMSGHVDGNEINIHVDQAYLVVTRALLAKIEGREP